MFCEKKSLLKGADLKWLVLRRSIVLISAFQQGFPVLLYYFCWNFSYFEIPDEEAKTETFAIRFSSPEIAQNFKAGFDEAVGKVTIIEAEKIKAEEKGDSDGGLEKQVSDLKLADEKAENWKLIFWKKKYFHFLIKLHFLIIIEDPRTTPHPF